MALKTFLQRWIKIEVYHIINIKRGATQQNTLGTVFKGVLCKKATQFNAKKTLRPRANACIAKTEIQRFNVFGNV